MQIQVLASGSKGNVVFVEIENQRFLVDIGLSYKQLKNVLDENEIDVMSISAVFITHEHSDHIKGLKTFCNKHKEVPVYLSQGTFENLKEDIQVVLQAKRRIRVGDSISFEALDDIRVEVFELSHDANEPTGYIFHHQNKKAVILTDTGYVSERVREKISGADVYVLEFNHDPELLRHSHYPWHIKQRILSSKGHLSNEDAAYLLEEIAGEQTRHVVFAHMSESNNLCVLVEDAIKKHVTKGFVNFVFAYQHQATEKIFIENSEG